MNATADRHLVPVKPVQYRAFVCPSCGSGDIACNGVLFPGAHVLGDHRCNTCGLDFLRDFPVGFSVDHPIAIGKADGRLFNPFGAESWLYGPLLNAFKNRSDAPVKIERKVLRPTKRIIILDTIDFLYGHVLLKLYNAQHYIDNYPDHGVVVLLPRMFAWLEPKGCAEVWIVDVKLGQGQAWHIAINTFVQQRLVEYDEVNMARGYAHPDFTHIDVERYTGIAPFQTAGVQRTSSAHHVRSAAGQALVRQRLRQILFACNGSPGHEGSLEEPLRIRSGPHDPPKHARDQGSCSAVHLQRGRARNERRLRKSGRRPAHNADGRGHGTHVVPSLRQEPTGGRGTW
ncbi:MAG: hypothetical protein IPG74_11905 [Flavobacteriales bacterium]|nr:hypothetical protein [Flavobacteriales bacterium]